MADKPKGGGGSDAMKDLKGLLWILLGLFFLWYMSGGYERAKQNQTGPYLNRSNETLFS